MRDGDYADPHIGGLATDHDATARAARSSHCALRTLEWMEAPTQRRQRGAAKRRLALSKPTHRHVMDRSAGGRQPRQRQRPRRVAMPSPRLACRQRTPFKSRSHAALVHASAARVHSAIASVHARVSPRSGLAAAQHQRPTSQRNPIASVEHSNIHAEARVAAKHSPPGPTRATHKR